MISPANRHISSWCSGDFQGEVQPYFFSLMWQYKCNKVGNEGKVQSRSSHQTSQGNNMFSLRLTRCLAKPHRLQNTIWPPAIQRYHLVHSYVFKCSLHSGWTLTRYCHNGSSLTAGSLTEGGGSVRISLARGMYVLACVSKRVGLQVRVTMKFSCSEYGGGGSV